MQLSLRTCAPHPAMLTPPPSPTPPTFSTSALHIPAHTQAHILVILSLWWLSIDHITFLFPIPLKLTINTNISSFRLTLKALCWSEDWPKCPHFAKTSSLWSLELKMGLTKTEAQVHTHTPTHRVTFSYPPFPITGRQEHLTNIDKLTLWYHRCTVTFMMEVWKLWHSPPLPFYASMFVCVWICRCRCGSVCEGDGEGGWLLGDDIIS